MIWVEAFVALLLLVSGALVVAAALGLWRLPDFFIRMHAPALASTLGTWLVTFASIAFFTAHEGHAALYIWLVTILMSITSPVTAMLLARAALFRNRNAGGPVPPPLTTIRAAGEQRDAAARAVAPSTDTEVP